MKRLIILFTFIGLVLVGCNQYATNGKVEKPDSTKQRVYSSSWDGNPIIVEQRNNEDYETVNKITDPDDVKILIKALGNADWQENVKVDIEPLDYRFSWNSFTHSIWINQEYERLELLIEGQSNFGTLSVDSSEVVFEILTGNKLNANNEKNRPLVLEDSGTVQNVLHDSPEYLAKNELELSIHDSETAYEMCVSALTDYYKAVWNGSDIELDTFIENEDLKKYTEKKIQSQNDLYGNDKVKNIDIGAWEVAYMDDANGGFLYLDLPVHINKFVGGYGEGTEFLVRNFNGKLVIVDWYTGAKDSYDFMVRGENLTIDNPTIWNDSEWVNKLKSKQNEFSGSTR